MSGATVTIPVEHLAKAFEAWETSYRNEPTSFKSPEDCAKLGVSQVSMERAEYFHQLLQETK